MSRFRPSVPQKRPNARLQAGSSFIGAMARVLVIDDNEAVREVLGRMLRRAGHEVLEASDGDAGLHLLRNHVIDLVTVDIFMPGRGGLSTIPELRKEWPQLRILAISGADREGPLHMAERATALGADDFLRKPFETSELLRVIGTLLPESPPSPKPPAT